MASEFLRPHQQHEAIDDVIVARFTGCKVSLDVATLPSIRDQRFALAEEMNPSQLLLDFGNVECVTGVALGMLVTLHKKLLARGRRLTVSNLNPPVYEVFTVTGLETSLNLRPEEPGCQPSPQDRHAGSSTGVLVVDDEPGVRSVLEAWLRREGFEVWSAAHGQQAVELYRRYQDVIAVVLLEVVMPGMDGPHTLIALQKICPAVRCCFMTGNPNGYTEECLWLLGAVRVFRKPFAFPEVLDVLKQLASRSPQRRQDRWIEIPRQRSVNHVGAKPQAG
jgi:anti-anti-sigma factor